MSSIRPVARARSSSRVTIYDVAREAGVAISTVSRVLNNAHDVSDDTRARIFATMEQLRYRPHRTAKMLAQQRTPTIAVAMPSFTTPTHMELLKGVRDRLREEDVDLLICDLGSTHPVVELRRFFRRGAIDGLLVAGVEVPGPLTREMTSSCRALVTIGQRTDGADSFTWSHAAAARLAVAHLARQGHRRIGMITTPEADDRAKERVQGYRQALREAGLPSDERLVRAGTTPKHGGVSEEAGYEAMQALLALDPAVTAVFAGSDAQAIGARQAAMEQGLLPGRDVALVGFDNLKVSGYIGLSTIDLGVAEIGYKATELVLKRIRGEHTAPPLAQAIRPRLVVRESSLPCAA